MFPNLNVAGALKHCKSMPGRAMAGRMGLQRAPSLSNLGAPGPR
eukprot:gene21360-57137_t